MLAIKGEIALRSRQKLLGCRQNKLIKDKEVKSTCLRCIEITISTVLIAGMISVGQDEGHRTESARITPTKPFDDVLTISIFVP
jgi:hypothetical protein